MVSTLAILAASALVLWLAWVVIRPSESQIRSLNDWETKKREIDLDAFRLLLDSAEEHYLRSALPRAEFRVFQRQRLALAMRSLDLVGQNAAMLVKLGQLAKAGADPQLAKEAEELVRGALRLRVNLMFVQPCLGLKWLFPGWTVSVPGFALPYEELLSYLNRIRQQQWDAEHVLMAS